MSWLTASLRDERALRRLPAVLLVLGLIAFFYVKLLAVLLLAAALGFYVFGRIRKSGREEE
jgi:hypothetical protein